MSDRETMEAAREAIKAKDFDKARALLAQVKNDKAREWESKLPAPAVKKTSVGRRVFRGAVMLLIVAGLVVAAIKYAEMGRIADAINTAVEQRPIITEPNQKTCDYKPGGVC